MRDTLRRVMNSRVAWFLAVIAWVWEAGRYWYAGLSEGFSELKIVQVVLVTGIAAFCVWAFVLNRAWRKRNNDP